MNQFGRGFRTRWANCSIILATDGSSMYYSRPLHQVARHSGAAAISSGKSQGCSLKLLILAPANLHSCYGNRASLRTYSSRRGRFSSRSRNVCPNCGVAGSLAPLSATSAFVRCSSCRQFFINQSTTAASEEDASEQAAAAAAKAISDIIRRQRIHYPREVVYSATEWATEWSKIEVYNRIRAHLDQYVVGQESAKRLLSVQAYAHYRRLQHNLLGNEQEAAQQLEEPISQLTPLSKAAGGAQFLSGLMNRQQQPVSNGKEFPSFKDILRAIGLAPPMRVSASESPEQQPEPSHSVRLSKSNVLLIGPSGSGKSLLVWALAELLGVPFASCSCAGLTQTGYSGAGVESAIANLLIAAGGCPGQARTGVLFLDEIDKLASASKDAPSTANVGDVGGVGVQRDLLRLLDGAEVGVSTGEQDGSAAVQVDTTDILFVASGTFNGLSNIVRRREGRAVAVAEEEDAALLARAEPSDLVEFGLLPELVGRLPAVGRLSRLRPTELARVLTEPREALARQFDRLLAADGCQLVLEPGAALAIGEAAARLGLGARGLRAIFEALLVRARYEAPGAGQPSEVRLTADCCRLAGAAVGLPSAAPLRFIGKGQIKRN